MLTVPWVVEALSRATAPFLLVGGTADKLWHGMYVPGPLAESIAVLGRVIAGVEEFLESISWS